MTNKNEMKRKNTLKSYINQVTPVAKKAIHKEGCDCFDSSFISTVTCLSSSSSSSIVCKGE